VSVERALELLRPWVHGDNESSFRDIVASRLVLADLLPIAGVSPGSSDVALRLERPDHSRVSVTLEPMERQTKPTWLTLPLDSLTAPFYRRRTSQPFWYQVIDSAQVFWIQFNAVRDADGETLAAFSARALRAAEQSSAKRLVIDIRRNNGGDN